MVAFGIVGYVFRRLDFPLAPMVLALVLGPLLESNFRRALTISRGDPMVFVDSGISIGLLVAATLLLALPVVLSKLGGTSMTEAEDGGDLTGPKAPGVTADAAPRDPAGHATRPGEPDQQ